MAKDVVWVAVVAVFWGAFFVLMGEYWLCTAGGVSLGAGGGVDVTTGIVHSWAV